MSDFLIFRAKRNFLCEAMVDACVYNSVASLIKDTIEYLKGLGYPATKEWLSIEESNSNEDNEMIGWCASYDVVVSSEECPRTIIGTLCFLKDIDRSKPWNAATWNSISMYKHPRVVIETEADIKLFKNLNTAFNKEEALSY